MNSGRRALAGAFFVLAMATPSPSYELLPPFPEPETTLWVGELVASRASLDGSTSNFAPSATASNGVTFSQRFEWSMLDWNAATPFSLSINRSYSDPCANDARNGVDIRSDICGDAFGSTTLAVTGRSFNPFTLELEANVIFNDAIVWDIHSGAGNPEVIDFQRVALHELGHVIGLNHEDDVPAIMNTFYGELETLQPDDIAGVCALYSASACPPDYLVESPGVSDATPAPGQAVTLSATVKNQGGGSQNTTTLRYYRSVNSDINPVHDVQIGTDAVPALEARTTSPESISVLAPSSLGSFYLGACVDAVPGEVLTGNQCSTGVEILVGGGPDLVVQSPVVSDSGPLTDQSITLSVDVRNQGSSTSATTTLRYYQSVNSIISGSDLEIGTDSVIPLGAGGASPESISLLAPSSAGTYYVGACVDAVADESSTSNQCSTAVRIVVGDRPDLVVQSPVVSDTTPLTGQTITLSVNVKNQGLISSPASTVRYYRSINSEISVFDSELGADPVGVLGVGESSPENISLLASSGPGTYHLGACVDAVAGESSTSNQCSAGIQIVVEARSDLVVESPVISDTTPSAGQAITLSVTVRNSGFGSSEVPTTLRYYRSVNSDINPVHDIPIGTDAVPALAAGGTSPENISVLAPDSLGTYYLGACVDAIAGESSTSNQCSAGVRIVVGSGPDLIVKSPIVSDATPSPGQVITLSVTVRNLGPDSSQVGTTLRFYRSANSVISTSDLQVGSQSVGTLFEGGRTQRSVSVLAPNSPGVYYLGACVDSVAGELQASNQCSAGVRIVVGGGPDLVVQSPVVSDSAPLPGQSVTLSVTVRNQGSTVSASTTLFFRRSQNESIDSGDHFLVAYSVPVLQAGAAASRSTVVNAPLGAGTYYLGACVGSVSGELSTNNQCSQGARITVAVDPTPENFSAAGGYQAYLSDPSNADLILAGICDEAAAFAHWRDFGSSEGRSFASGRLRSDIQDASPDPDYAIDGGFSWEYPGANTVVFITADAPKPGGWAGRALLLERCQAFNLGAHYNAQTYRSINTDVRDAIDQGLVPSFQSVTDHYMKYGFKEGRLTSSDWTEAQVNAWNDAGYLTANPDVAGYFQGAANDGWSLFGKVGFAHWVNFGRYEGRSDGQ